MSTPKRSFSPPLKHSISVATSSQSEENSNGRFIHGRSSLLSKPDGIGLSRNEETQGPFLSLLKSSILRTDNIFTCSQPFASPSQISPKGSISDMFYPEEPSFTNSRKIPKFPYKALDAPNLLDDFYMNVLDWSCNNLLAVALNKAIYLWSDTIKPARFLHELCSEPVSSLSWSPQGTHLAIGTSQGKLFLYDVEKDLPLRCFKGHNSRIGTLSWNSVVLSSGSRDQIILQHDFRSPSNYFSKLSGHKQEICGLKWSFDGEQLASGGNDNKIFIWSSRSSNPIEKFSSHTAAVKAIAWSPHQRGLLASGGGTADKTIKFWDTFTLKELSSYNTYSQVCNIVFSKTTNELVSTHGFSQHQITVWNYPTMQKIGTMLGHTKRVLYLAMSADGQNIVTGAGEGDETLRFWNVFPGNNEILGNCNFWMESEEFR